MPEGFWESLWNPASYLKVLFLICTYPVWGPIVKILWEELQEALAPEGGLYGRAEKRAVARRPPGQDPWVNVPLARHRGRIGGAPPPRATQPQRSAARGSGGRSPGARTAPAAQPAGRPAVSGGGRRRGF